MNSSRDRCKRARVVTDEPAPLAPAADLEAGASELTRPGPPTVDLPTSKGQAVLDTADRYAGKAHAHAAKCVYRSDRAHFGDWCQVHASAIGIKMSGGTSPCLTLFHRESTSAAATEPSAQQQIAWNAKDG